MKATQNRCFNFISCVTIVLLAGANQASHGQNKSWLNPIRPNNCEDALALLDETAIDARKDKESNIIVVARLGNGEKLQSRSRRRLIAAIDYLKEKAENKVVAASGERIKGYGRLEFYVGGKLLYVIAYPRNGIIDCRSLE